jgi:hypothetical protein
MTLGPSHGAGPSVGGGAFSIIIGVCGLAFISFDLIAGKVNDVSRWKIVVSFAVFLFFIVVGAVQLFEVR